MTERMEKVSSGEFSFMTKNKTPSTPSLNTPTDHATVVPRPTLTMSYTLYVTSNAPDRHFRDALSSIDNALITTDNFLDTSQAQLRTAKINVFGEGIRSLLGIEYFMSLTNLNCSDNALTDLALSNLASLTHLNCTQNTLTSLDLEPSRT